MEPPRVSREMAQLPRRPPQVRLNLLLLGLELSHGLGRVAELKKNLFLCCPNSGPGWLV